MSDFLKIIFIVISFQATSSRRHDSSSEESIENLLYYKDCQRPKEETTTASLEPLRLRVAEEREEPRREPECPFPRMCCSMTCGNECNQPFTNRPIEPQNTSPNVRQPNKPVQPQINQLRKKKIKPMGMLPPIGGRRSFGLTKEKIKGLISHDDDIRKILRDLVRVTMQKVEVLDMIHNNKNGVRARNNDDDDNFEYDYAYNK
ncbi:uncharacterized protein LOC110386589 [Bombyx mori]|uniref:Uncharacterized protein n=1 Tax=Bombyx mori TaxID=7091 RepID=A0A8R2QW90_BOMMO|nr:uncharacterized protein LOC110386589 [Bombyx mori]